MANELDRIKYLAGLSETPGEQQYITEDIDGHGPETMKFSIGPSVKASQLKKGEYYAVYFGRGDFAKYGNLMQFMGVSDPKTKYGEGGPAYDSVKDVAREYGVKNQSELEQIHRSVKNFTQGNGAYLCMKLFEPKSHLRNEYIANISNPNLEGCYFYLADGRWVWGSGAHSLRFASIKQQ